MKWLRVADRVGLIEEADVVFAARLPDGPIVALEGTAALIWRRALDGPQENAVIRVSEDVSAAPADIQDEVERFIDELIKLGLLAPAEGR